ncbi:hypothetical protein OGAPHI_001160 [Ogataea philodendri]|uniref:Genetic interactor of prohibitin 7, mitochondrial n=1 Tax=Ogataea philodendri TaxID=1378263 RepID=A0A9P8PFK7_9ASCO|nr:uncharacterized protein OGAPHI_001160 [Ogataea philodendri]KAH3670645.1 hypothetical protein OGAPHI_001160 [Ogataea philodendri]
MLKTLRGVRFYSGRPVPSKLATARPDARLLNDRLKKEQDLRRERNKLALSSLKDIFAIFSPTAGDDDELDTSNFDPAPVYANPPSYLELSLPKQQFIVDELDDKFRRHWKNVDPSLKRFAYWLAYGSYGPRAGFDNPQLTAPPDLPFVLPSAVKTAHPAKTTTITQLPARNPQLFGEKRTQQAQKDKKLNPYNQFVLALVLLLSVLNYLKDKKINDSGTPPDYGYLQGNQLVQMDELSKKLAAAVAVQPVPPPPKKWYYLYMK